MNIIIEQALKEDIPELTKAMTSAFDHDAQVHCGVLVFPLAVNYSLQRTLWRDPGHV